MLTGFSVRSRPRTVTRSGRLAGGYGVPSNSWRTTKTPQSPARFARHVDGRNGTGRELFARPSRCKRAREKPFIVARVELAVDVLEASSSAVEAAPSPLPEHFNGARSTLLLNEIADLPMDANQLSTVARRPRIQRKESRAHRCALICHSPAI